MGLDQYLYARIKAPAGSPFHKIVEENISVDERKQLETKYEDGSGESAYISGWAHMDPPSALYKALSEACFTPHPDSPHFTVEPDGAGGYVIDGTLFYWRKVNAVHHWFVEEIQGGVDECQESPAFDPERLDPLFEACQQVVDDGAAGADEVLPTQGGFFFGSTDYDEYYLEGIKDTLTLKDRLALVGDDVELFYQSSW